MVLRQLFKKRKMQPGSGIFFFLFHQKKMWDFFFYFNQVQIKIPKKRGFKANINLAMNVLILDLLAQTK